MMAARSSVQLGTPGGASRASRPSPTSTPIAACSTDFAIDQESSGVPGSTGSGGRSKWGSAPAYRSRSSRPPWTIATA